MRQQAKANISPSGRRAARSQKARERKTIRATADLNFFGSTPPAKPAHPSIEQLLPYLEERIAFKMPSEIKFLDGVLEYLNDRMLRLGFVQPEEPELIIALDEAIVNAIKHGNCCDPTKSVSITAEFLADGLRFIIADEGPGFDRHKVPNPTDPCRLLEPNGRGLYLIHHIMDEVCYNEAGNHLTMFKRIERRRQAQASEDRQ